MNGHLPGCLRVANFGHSQNGQEQFGREAGNFLKNEVHVDDGLNVLCLHLKMLLM